MPTTVNDIRRAKRTQRFVVQTHAEACIVIIAWGEDKHIKDALFAWDYPEDTDGAWDEGNAGITFSRPGRHPLIALRKPPKTPSEIGTLVHEAVHAAMSFFQHVKTNVNEETEELFCLHVDCIVRQALDNFAAIAKVKL